MFLCVLALADWLYKNENQLNCEQDLKHSEREKTVQGLDVYWATVEGSI